MPKTHHSSFPRNPRHSRESGNLLSQTTHQKSRDFVRRITPAKPGAIRHLYHPQPPPVQRHQNRRTALHFPARRHLPDPPTPIMPAQAGIHDFLSDFQKSRADKRSVIRHLYYQRPTPLRFQQKRRNRLHLSVQLPLTHLLPPSCRRSRRRSASTTFPQNFGPPA